MKECDIFRGGGQNILWPPLHIFRGGPDPRNPPMIYAPVYFIRQVAALYRYDTTAASFLFWAPHIALQGIVGWKGDRSQNG